MLRLLDGNPATTDRPDPAKAIWFDLLNPGSDERVLVAQATGLRLPEAAEIAEIETSSRLVNQDGVLTLSTPMLSRDDTGQVVVSQLGFVVSQARLVTLRYAKSQVFDDFSDRWRRSDHPSPGVPCGGIQPFIGLLEAMVDRLADVLEKIGSDLEALAGRVFQIRAEGLSSRRRDNFLRDALSQVGRVGTLVSNVRDGLLGLVRIARFVTEAAAGWLAEAEASRLKTLERDIVSLTDYDAQLTNKVQFTLDAILGFISIEQANTFKLLTVVSIVGIPPTFIASLYGMNFKNMPELNWQYGYQYGLTLIALSIIVPLVWFRLRGWL